jgi:hypothetical protein
MAQPRPSVFVGSSSEGLNVARNIQALLDRECEVKLWDQGAPTTDILERIRKLGFRESARVRHLEQATHEVQQAGDQIQQLVRLLARSRKVELDVIASQFGPLISPNHLSQMRQDLEDLENSLGEK